MNLRVKKSSLARNKKNGNNNIVYVGICVIIIAFLCFGVFGSTAYLDGQSQKINKEISSNDYKIYNFRREIQNLKILLAAKSRKEFVVAKIKEYNLGLHTPESYQVVNLQHMGNEIYIQGSEFAYNTR